MSDLKYYAYDPVGVEKQQKFRYSQAVRIGDRIECAGQGKSKDTRTSSRNGQVNQNCP
jgi:hypothetical protein